MKTGNTIRIQLRARVHAADIAILISCARRVRFGTSVGGHHVQGPSHILIRIREQLGVVSRNGKRLDKCVRVDIHHD